MSEQLPERISKPRDIILTEEQRRRRAIKLVLTTGGSVIALFFLPYAWELSDVKPNIFYACALWLLIFCCFASAFWVWAEKLPKWARVLINATVLSLLVWCFKDWAVEQYRRQHQAVEPDKPNLGLILKTPEFQEVDLELTNALFFSSPTAHVFTIGMTILIPLTNNALILQVAVRNRPGGEIADGLQIILSFSDDLECSPVPDWQPASSAFKGTRTLVYRDNRKLFPATILACPMLSFNRRGGWIRSPTDAPTLMYLSAETRGVSRSTAAFQLVCPIVRSPQKPRFVLPGANWAVEP